MARLDHEAALLRGFQPLLVLLGRDPGARQVLYGEFIEIVRDPLLRSQRVLSDFEFSGVEMLAASDAIERALAMGTNNSAQTPGTALVS